MVRDEESSFYTPPPKCTVIQLSARASVALAWIAWLLWGYGTAVLCWFGVNFVSAATIWGPLCTVTCLVGIVVLIVGLFGAIFYTEQALEL